MGGDRRHTPLAYVVFALLVWPLAAFGGRSRSTAVAFGVASVIVATFVSFRHGGRAAPGLAAGIERRLGFAIVAALSVVLFELVPLPAPIVAAVSPNAALVRSALSIDGQPPGAWYPLTISRSDTGWAWIVAAGAAAVGWTALALFRRGGVRKTVRLVSAAGFAVSLLAIAQAATAGRAIYWRFATEHEGPLPFGPFVNRNHFATWTIMALPVCLGYISARAGAGADGSSHASSRARLARAIDPRTAWLVAAGATMLVALLLSLSRSGALALGVSAATTAILCRRRLDARRRRRVLAATAVVVLVGVAWADIPALRERLAGAQTGVANRVTIWRETRPIVRDFWLTGTGAGTYQRAMFVYQRSPRKVYFNQAHNHYLQAAAEGGLLVVGAALAALVAFFRAARTRLIDDVSGLFWIRAGAACGLGAVALQSVWETGLVMPANASLAAVLAALVVHERAGKG